MNNRIFRAGRQGRARGDRSATFFLVLLFLGVACPAIPAQRQFPVPPNQLPGAKVDKVSLLKMRVEEGKVTADIADSPLQAVLRELADRTGIIFEVRSHENPLVSIHLKGVSVEEAIKRITSGNNALFLYGQGAESERITMVRVFPRTAPVQQPGLVYLGTGTITKTNYTIDTPEQALKVLSTNASIQDREIGIGVLAKTRSDEAVKALMNCVSDPAPEIRVAALEGLGAMGAHAALPVVLKSLKDANPGVRQSAATVVALLGDARNLKDLGPLSLDRDASVAAAAEAAIRKLSAAGKK